MRFSLAILLALAACVDPSHPGELGTDEQSLTTNHLIKTASGGGSADSSLIDDGSRVTTSEIFGGSSVYAWYMNGNELNAGYDQDADTTGYVNYSGYHGSNTRSRSTCMMNGKQPTTCDLFLDGVHDRVGINQNNPAVALDVIGGLNIGLASGMTGRLYIAPDLSVGNFTLGGSGVGGFGFGVGSPISPVDITNDGETNRTNENPIFTHELTNADTASYDTTAADRRSYGNFWDGSPAKNSLSHMLTFIELRLDARSPDKRVSLWNDEGEVWQDTHVMYNVRPNGGGAPAPSLTGAGCGTSPAISGNDNMGRVTMGTGTTGACAVAFAEHWQDHTLTDIVPACIAVDENGTTLAITPAATSLTFTCSSCAGHHVVYHCSGSDPALPGP